MLRIASYNIRKAVGLDGVRNPGRIVSVINEIEADIVVLQEADLRLGNRPTALPFDLISKHTDYRIADFSINEISMGWHGNAILFNKEVSLGKLSRIDLPGLEPRGSICASIDVRNEPLTIYGVHLGLVRHWRRRQLDAILQTSTSARLDRSIIIGDFNEWSNHKGLETLRNRLSVLSPGKSFHAAWPVMALDKIAYGSELIIENAGIKQTSLASVASDHLPIWADIALNPTSAKNT